MENSYNRQERGPSYELRQCGPSDDLAPTEAPQANSSNHLPLDVASIDLVKRRLEQRHIQMYVCGSASFPHNFLLLIWSFTTG